jgi:hypothetical protein
LPVLLAMLITSFRFRITTSGGFAKASTLLNVIAG